MELIVLANPLQFSELDSGPTDAEVSDLFTDPAAVFSGLRFGTGFRRIRGIIVSRAQCSITGLSAVPGVSLCDEPAGSKVSDPTSGIPSVTSNSPLGAVGKLDSVYVRMLAVYMVVLDNSKVLWPPRATAMAKEKR